MVVSAQFTLSNTTPTQIVAPSTQPQEVWLHNHSKSSNNFIHIGAADVTIDNSIHIDPSENLTVHLMPNDSLFAVSNPNGLVVGVLAIRQD